MIKSLAKKNIFKTRNKFLSQKNVQFMAKDTGRVSFFKSLFNPGLVLVPVNNNKGYFPEPSNSDYDALINCNDDYLWSVSKDFKLVAANHAFIKSLEESVCITFKPGDSLLIDTIFPAAFLAFWKSCYVKALSGDSFHKEVFIPAFNRTKATFLDISFNPIYTNGEISGIACHSRDITEKKNTEEKIKQSESRLVESQALAKIGSWETDLVTFNVIWSLETYRIFEVDPNAFHASHPGFLEFVHPDEREKVDAAFVNSLHSSNTVNTIEHRILTASGHIKMVEERWCIFYDNDGNPSRAVGTCQDITERTDTAGKIKETEVRYHSLIEQATEAICIAGPSMNIIDINPMGCQMLGYTKEEFLHLGIADLFIADDLKKDPFRIDQLKTGNIISNERRFKRKDGSLLEVELNARILKDGKFVVFARDISERKQAEKELQAAYQEKNTILESIDDGFFAIDNNSLVTYWNRKAEELLGEKRETVIGRNLHEMFARPDSIIFYEHYQKAIREKSTVHFEGFSTRSNKWFAVSAFASGNGLSVHFKDVTERKTFEEKIKESEIRYRSLIEQATDAICITDASFKFIDVNPYACDILGYTNEEALQLGFTDIVFTEDLVANPFKYKEAETGTIIRNERRLKRKDGTAVVMEVSTKLMGDGKFILFGHDVSERRAAEYRLKESELSYRSLFEQAADTICMADSSFRFTDINPSGCRMFGYTREEFIQLGFSDVLLKDDLLTNPIRVEDLKAGKHTSNERRVITKSGEILDLELSGKMLEDGRIIIFGRDISERKKSEGMLKESETRYRTLFEQNMAGVYQSSEKGVILNCNNAFAKMLKYDSPEELLKINASQLYFSPAERNDFTFNVTTQKKINNYESVLKCKDGSPLYFIENISMWEDDITGEVFFDGIMIDITEKKQAERLLKQSNERYNLISKATNDMVWDWDLITGKVYRNKEGWKKIFRTGDRNINIELIGDWNDRIHPEDQHTVKAVTDEIKNSKKDFFEVECRVMRDDGTYAYIHDRGNIIRNERGEAVRLIGATQDITQRKEAEFQVVKSEMHFRSLVQNSSDLTGILNARGYYLYSSPAIKKILGYEPEFMIGKNAFSFVHPDDIIILKTHLLKDEHEKYKNTAEFRFKNAQGEWRWLESKITDMSENPEVQGYIFNSRDVTERKMAEKTLIKTSEELQHALTEQVSLRKKTEESETRLKEAQAIAHLGHWHLNFTTQTAVWSDEACRIYGLPPEENEQSYAAWLSFVHPEDLDYVMKTTTELQKTLSDIILNHRIVLKDGTVKYIASKSKFEFDENGKPVGMYGIAHDVTDRKITEAEIEKLSFIARETSNSVVITDTEGEIVWVNEAFARITEFGFDEVIGKKPGDILQGEETSLAVVRYMRNKLKKVEPFECDILNYSKSGRKYWLRIQCQPQFDETGKLKYFFAIETDVTKEKEAEEILKTSEERYRYLFNNNPASIIIWDIDNFEILEINDTTLNMYGYTRKEFLSKKILDLRRPEFHDSLKAFAGMARQKHDFVSVNTWRHLNKSGEEMYMNIASHRIQFKGREVLLSLATNITEKIFLEKELENERLIKQQEITAAVISAQEQERQELGSELHDNINQILAGSRLYLGLATKELHIEHPYLTETDTLINSAITEIRNLSHSLIPPSLHESELLGAINNIVEVTQKTSGIVISLQAYGFDETKVSDKLKLSIYRIIQEQISNILKHAAAQKIIVRLLQDKEKTILSIKDDGAGFDTRKKAKGVGLMNIKTRASLFNGEMSVISSPGNGCELRVVFN